MKGSHVFNLHQSAIIKGSYDFSMASKSTVETIARNTRAVLHFVKSAHAVVEHEQYCAHIYGQKFAPFESVDKGTALEFLTVQDVIVWC